MHYDWNMSTKINRSLSWAIWVCAMSFILIWTLRRYGVYYLKKHTHYLITHIWRIVMASKRPHRPPRAGTAARSAALRHGGYEEKFRLMADLVESAALCIISTDGSGRITSINRAGETMYGYRARELLGKHISILNAQGNAPSVIVNLVEKASRGEAWEGEILDRKKDGTVFPIWISTSYLFDASGRRTGGISIIRDVTAQKKAEEELRYTAELVESAGHSIISTDRGGNIRSINTAGQRMFGYRAEELIGKPVSVLEPRGGLPERLVRMFRGKRRRGENWEAEGLGRRRNGETFPLWLATSYLRDERGRIKGAVGISRDISLLKEYQEKTGYMAELVEKASMGIISTDPRNRIVSINRAGELMYGYSARELIGKDVSVLYSDRNPPGLLARIRGKSDALEPWSAELYRRRKDGSDFVSWLSTGYLYDERGRLKAKVCIERDVTEQRETEKRLADAEHLANIGELAAGIAHEIRNPLGGIHTSVKMLLEQEGQRIGGDEMSLLRIIEKESSRLQGIVTDFLRFGRPQEPILGTADLGAYLAEWADSIRRGRMAGDGTEVIFDLPGEPLPVLIDRDQMQQVFLNLAINAFHAMGGGGRLRIRARRAGAVAEVSVEDTGGGIRPADLPNIFKPFFSRKKGGTGLGLPIVRRIVLAHRGTIRCESAVGKGTRFTIELPLDGGGTP